MIWKGILKWSRLCAVALLAAVSLQAAEHHGTVLFHGMPVPGATVTATHNGKQLTTVTDQNGAYSFRELEDGVWTIQVEMPCFSTAKRDLMMARDTAATEWDL